MSIKNTVDPSGFAGLLAMFMVWSCGVVVGDWGYHIYDDASNEAGPLWALWGAVGWTMQHVLGWAFFLGGICFGIVVIGQVSESRYAATQAEENRPRPGCPVCGRHD